MYSCDRLCPHQHELNDDTPRLLFTCLCARSLEESVSKPVCVVFRTLATMQEDNSGFSVLLEMLAEFYQKQPKIGYHLLYYLKAR